MNRVTGTVVGLVLAICGFFTIGYVVGGNRAEQRAAEAVEQARLVYEERTAADDHNGDVLMSYINGEISDEEASALMVEAERKTEFIPLEGGSGTITFGAYDPTEDPHATRRSPWGLFSCVKWTGENNYDCGEDPRATVKCVIYVIRESGPMAGTTFYAKKCDGLPISRRSSGKGVRDGYIIVYDFSKFVPKPK